MNDTQLQVLVDTGATNTIIHETALSRLGYYKITPGNQKFRLANESSISIVGNVSLEVKIQHIKTYVTAAITRTLCCDMILGEDWIGRNKIIINRRTNTVEIQEKDASVALQLWRDEVSLLQRTRHDSKQESMNKRTRRDVHGHSTNEIMPSADDCSRKGPRNRGSADIWRMQEKKPEVSWNGTQTGLDDERIKVNRQETREFRPWEATTPMTQDQRINIQKTLEQAIEHIEPGESKVLTKQLIERYWEIFDTTKPTIATTPIHHTIPTGDHPPVNSSPYRGSLEQQRALTKMLDELERAKQIRPSSSPWSSPVVLIKKSDGGHRFVVDYRRLNAITAKDSYPLPTIESTLQQLAGNRWFSKLDLRSGYFQIPIDEADKPKTAFITTTGLWEFNVLPMGLCNAPPVFQRIMYELLVKGREDHCLVYIDDIIIFSKTIEEHRKHLDEILGILHRNQFQLSPKKCSIMKDRIDYLGHTVDGRGVKPLHENIKAIRDLPLPNYPSLKQANEFTGGLGFYRKFIRNFSKIAAPLHRVTNLTKNNRKKFEWGEEQRRAVEQLKSVLTGPELVLEFPDPHLPFLLSTDASNVGLGAILKQVTRQGQIKVIYYLSRVLSKAETRYSTTELEALAMVWAISKLRAYLLGRDFEIETDHCPLCQLHKKKSRNGRLDRWAIEILSEYNITNIRYKKGKCHCDADLLSRYPLEINPETASDSTVREQQKGYLFSQNGERDGDDNSEIQPTAIINVMTRSRAKVMAQRADETGIENHQEEELNTTRPVASSETSRKACEPITITMRQVREEQREDPVIQERMKNTTSDPECVVEGGILYKVVSRGTATIKLPWIPKAMVDRIMYLYHDHHTAAHMGYNKTTEKLTKKYYWPNMHQTVAAYIRACAKCAKHNYRRTKLPGKMNITPMPGEVMGLVGMDFCGPIEPLSRSGNRYVITMTDYLSKFTFAKAVPSNSAREAVEFFLDICYHYGAPTKLVTDQGPHFTAELTRMIIQSCNTTHVLATPYHPMSIAQTERFNATFAPAVAKLVNEEKQDWDSFLQPVLYAYNTSSHATTALSPFQVMFGRESQLFVEPKQLKISLSKPSEYYDKFKRSRSMIIQHAKANIQYQTQLAKRRFDRNRPDPRHQVNDLVLVRANHSTTKLQEKYEGPYRIIEQKGPSTFIVRIESAEEDVNPEYTRQVTTADIKAVFDWKSGKD